jgi:hypothetical protein
MDKTIELLARRPDQAPRGGDEVRHRCIRPEGDQSRSGAAQGSQASPPLLRRPGVILLASSDPGRVEEKQR